MGECGLPSSRVVALRNEDWFKSQFFSARIVGGEDHLKTTYLRNLVSVMFRLGNFSLNCSFKSFFNSEGFA